MGKVWYDVIENEVLKEQPKSLANSKKYFLINDTIEDKNNAVKKFLLNIVNEFIKDFKGNIIRFNLKTTYSYSWSTTYTYLYINYSLGNVEKRRKISSMGFSRIKKALDEISDEIYAKYNVFINRHVYNTYYDISYTFYFLDNVDHSVYSGDGLSIYYKKSVYPTSVILLRKDFIKGGRELWNRLKIDIPSYTKGIKENLANIKKELAKSEKRVETLKKAVAEAQEEHDALEDYEKIIGELGTD